MLSSLANVEPFPFVPDDRDAEFPGGEDLLVDHRLPGLAAALQFVRQQVHEAPGRAARQLVNPPFLARHAGPSSLQPFRQFMVTTTPGESSESLPGKPRRGGMR